MKMLILAPFIIPLNFSYAQFGFGTTSQNNNAILDELESFAQAIENNTTPVVSLSDGTNALRVAQRIIDSF